MRFATRSALIALAIGGCLAGPRAQAQVQLFEEVPSLEQLRTILIPESAPSASRRIIINAPKPQWLQPAALTQPGAQAEAPAAPAPAAGKPASQEAAPAAAAPSPAPVVAATPATPPAAKRIAAPDGLADSVGFRINFAFASAAIPADSHAYLDKIAELLTQEPKLALTVEGHTDAVGGEEYNQELSLRRADAVRSYLVEHGVAPRQLHPVGRGKSEPLVDNPYDGRNRRVQFARTPDGVAS